jgi:hypothetical protein
VPNNWTIPPLITFAVSIILQQWSPSVVMAQGQNIRFDVNDVSYLWPVPKTTEDVARLISSDEMIADGSSPIWPKDAFDAILGEAKTIAITDAGGGANKIDFTPFLGQFSERSNWKVVAFRVDPSAPGASAQVISVFGSTPQLRLIIQPVTIDEKTGVVLVHDVTAHLVFSFIKGLAPPVSPGGPQQPIADRETFAALVDDLKTLKVGLQEANVQTSGKLAVHPGLKANVPGFSDKLRALLKKYVRPSRLQAAAENVPRLVEKVAAPVPGGYIPGATFLFSRTGAHHHATKVSEVRPRSQVSWQTSSAIQATSPDAGPRAATAARRGVSGRDDPADAVQLCHGDGTASRPMSLGG